MSLRLSETPWGAARFTYAYLAALLAGLAAGLIAAVAAPAYDSLAICRQDPGILCAVGLSGLTAGVVLAAGLFVTAYVFCLGWQWAAWFLALSLSLAELVIETSSVLWAIAGLFIPLLASAITYERPDRLVGRWWRRGRLVGLTLVFLQFVIWLVVAAISPS